MDFARKHRGRRYPDDAADAFGLAGTPVVIHSEGGHGTIAGTLVSIEDVGEILDLDAPRPCFRSIWDFYGLRRRPRRS